MLQVQRDGQAERHSRLQPEDFECFGCNQIDTLRDTHSVKLRILTARAVCVMEKGKGREEFFFNTYRMYVRSMIWEGTFLYKVH